MMNKLKLQILTTITSLAIGGVGYAETTYDSLLIKLQKHPAIEAVRQQVIQQQEAGTGASGLPDPMLTIGLNNFPVDGKGGWDRFAMSSKSIGFTQQIPNSGIRTASADGKLRLAEKAKIAVTYTYQQLVALFNTALAEQKRIRIQQNLIKEDLKLLQQEAAFWDGSLQAGKSALDERSRVSAEISQAEAKLATLKAEKSHFDAELMRLVGQSKNINLPSVNLIPWPNAFNIFPVKLAEKDVQVASANVSKAQSDFKPNYQLGASYAQRENSGSFDGGDFVSAKFGMSIPLWAKQNQAPKLRSAKAGVKRAKAMLEDITLRVNQQLITQYAKIKETEATKKALSEKEQAIKGQISSLKSSYINNGRLDKLIASKRSLLRLKLQIAQLNSRYIKQISNFNSFFEQEIIPTGETQ